MIIDSHVHFWEFDKKRDSWITSDMKVLRQNYLPEHLALNLKRNEVEGCIAIQAAQTELETHFLLELSETHPIIKGVVGWVDLKDERVEQRLDYFYQYPLLKGWRHIVQAEPPGFLKGEDFMRGIQLLKQYGYTYDILVYASQLREAAEFVSRFPDQVFVLDHCAKPDIRNNKIDEWRPLLKEIAQHPNLYCKLSGLFTETKWKEWSAGDFYPYLDTVFEAFGTDRLLFGSDWPVILLSGIYVQWKSLIEKYMENYPEEDRLKVFGLNAIKAYNINGA